MSARIASLKGPFVRGRSTSGTETCGAGLEVSSHFERTEAIAVSHERRPKGGPSRARVPTLKALRFNAHGLIACWHGERQPARVVAREWRHGPSGQPLVACVEAINAS